jgi:cyanophycinase
MDARRVSLLVRTIDGTPIPGVIQARFAAGVTVGGASAGAAAMSRTMIADETTPDGDDIHGPATVEGLGLWPEAIVSPHLTERHRLNALKAIMEDHPTLFGIGIDEGPAVIAQRRAEVPVRHAAIVQSPRGPQAGMRFVTPRDPNSSG